MNEGARKKTEEMVVAAADGYASWPYEKDQNKYARAQLWFRNDVSDCSDM